MIIPAQLQLIIGEVGKAQVAIKDQILGLNLEEKIMTAQNIFGAYNLEIDIMMLFTLAMKLWCK